MAPYVGRLPARDVAWMREQLAETLASDDTAATLLQGARPREVDESGEVACEPLDSSASISDDENRAAGAQPRPWKPNRAS